ncbi:MAG: hypothetical protein V4801_37755 [Burkholderia gladioli]
MFRVVAMRDNNEQARIGRAIRTQVRCDWTGSANDASPAARIVDGGRHLHRERVSLKE